MATKAEERKALEKIRKIVEELGENSYIGMAFEGCFEDAEENIEHDWGCSWKQRAEMEVRTAEEMRVNLNREADRLREQIGAISAESDELGEKYQKLLDDYKSLAKDFYKAKSETAEERKELTIQERGKEEHTLPFSDVRLVNHDGFCFFVLTQTSGWVTSYNVDDLAKFEIK